MSQIFFKKYPKISLDHYAYSALIGTVLGDTYLGIDKKGYEALLNYAHSLKQEQYALFKAALFKNLNGKVSYKSNKDKRTGKIYDSVYFRSKCNPYLTKIHKRFYRDRIKIIPRDLEKDFNEISLAFLFMDDGSHHRSGYYLSLCSFTQEDLVYFQDFLKERFGLKSTIHSQKNLYIWRRSVEKFNAIIEPHMTNDTKYKLLKFSINSVNLGKS